MTKGDLRWIKNWKPKGVSMNTTKKVAAKRVVKKKPAKRAYRKDSIVGKLLQLKYNINDMYRNGGPGIDLDETRADKGYVMNLIDGVRKFGWEKLSREDGIKCKSNVTITLGDCLHIRNGHNNNWFIIHR